MAFNYALQRINRQVRISSQKARKGAKDRDGKLVPESTRCWHSGRIKGLRIAKSAFYQGQRAGRKSGFKSGVRYGRSQRRYA